MRLEGVWVDRSGLYERVRKKNRQSKAVVRRQLDRATYKSYEKKLFLQLAPIPCWAGLEPREIAKLCRELIREILLEYAEVIETVRPGYRERITDKTLFQHRPEHRRSGVQPLVHAHDPQVWKRYADRANQFFRQFKKASERFRKGILDAVYEFPEQALLPSGVLSKFKETQLPPLATPS